jgi:hypothetical protein
MNIARLRKMASAEIGRRYLQSPQLDPVAETLLVKAASADQELLKIASRLPGDTLENYEELGGTFKTAADMPAFTKQDRPKKVKEIYRALKRDHPNMPAEMKARIAARQGKRGHQHQGPPYKGPLTKEALGAPMFQPAAPATAAMPRVGAASPIGTLKPPSPTNSMPSSPGSAGGGISPIKEPTITGAGSEAGKTATVAAAVLRSALLKRIR